MPSEEQKVPLIMQRHDLSALELWKSREESLEHSSDGVAETGDEVVEDEFGIVCCGAGVALHLIARMGRKLDLRVHEDGTKEEKGPYKDLFGERYGGEFEVCGRSIGEVYHRNRIYATRSIQRSRPPQLHLKTRSEEKQHILGFFIFSLTTTKFVYPLPAAQPAILPISNPLPFFGLLTNSAPGNTPTSSSQKS